MTSWNIVVSLSRFIITFVLEILVKFENFDWLHFVLVRFMASCSNDYVPFFLNLSISMAVDQFNEVFKVLEKELTNDD